MHLRKIIFFSTVISLLAAVCFYLAGRSIALYPPLQPHAGVVWGTVIGFLALQLGMPTLHRRFGPRADPLYWVSYFCFSLISTYFIYLASLDLLQTVVGAFIQLPAAVRSWTFLAAATLTLLSVSIGLAQGFWPIRIKRIDVPILDLPAGLEGFRIVQISDLHLGPLLSPSRVRRIVARANGLAPDLIAVTGDLADGDVESERSCLEALGELRAVHGVQFVTGNHEYYSGVEPWLKAVRSLGWRVLMNEHIILFHGNDPLAVIGIPDPAGKGQNQGPDLAKAMAGLEPGITKLLLFHQPIDVAKAERAGIHLQLSGHTHGGQYFPWSPIIRMFFDYPIGLHRHGSLWLYTSPGTGFWGPPNRFLVPPELTLIKFRRAPEPPRPPGVPA